MASLGEVTTGACAYVDDIEVMPKDEESLRLVSGKIGRALQKISLKSHPKKTEIVVSGKVKETKSMRDNLRRDPAMMQGNEIGVVESASYLGMTISESGFRETIHMTAKNRTLKAWGRVKEIKAVINDHRMKHIGWLKAGVLLIRSVVIPSITYSSETWAQMYKYTRNMIEFEYKSMIYFILDIPTTTKFTSVLADTGLPGIMSVIDKLRITFIDHTLWKNGDAAARELLREEEKLLGDESILGLVDRLCSEYLIPPVSRNNLNKKLVKRWVKEKDETERWISNLMSPVTENVGIERTRISSNFHRLSKRESQAIISFNAGNLRLKSAWKEFKGKDGCLVPFCDGRDTLDHLKVCRFYDTKWKESYKDDIKEFAKWLTRIDTERRRRWKGQSLI